MGVVSGVVAEQLTPGSHVISSTAISPRFSKKKK